MMIELVPVASIDEDWFIFFFFCWIALIGVLRFWVSQFMVCVIYLEEVFVYQTIFVWDMSLWLLVNCLLLLRM